MADSILVPFGAAAGELALLLDAKSGKLADFAQKLAHILLTATDGSLCFLI
jgi:hypothetical protein